MHVFTVLSLFSCATASPSLRNPAGRIAVEEHLGVPDQWERIARAHPGDRVELSFAVKQQVSNLPMYP